MLSYNEIHVKCAYFTHGFLPRIVFAMRFENKEQPTPYMDKFYL